MVRDAVMWVPPEPFFMVSTFTSRRGREGEHPAGRVHAGKLWPDHRQLGRSVRTFYGLDPVPGAGVQTSLPIQTGWFSEVERLAGR
jgi:hypothetical protein